MPNGDNGDERADGRSNLIVLRQFEAVMKYKRALLRAGLVDDDASATEVLEAMRKHVPPDLFGDSAPPTH